MSFNDLSKTQRDELAASLAVLALHDAGVEITADALSKTFEASGNDVAAYVAPLFADLLGRGLDVEKFLAGPSAGALLSGRRLLLCVATVSCSVSFF